MKQPSDLGVFVIVAGGALVGLDLFRRRAAATLDGFKYNEEDPTAMFAGFDLSEGLAANRPAPRLELAPLHPGTFAPCPSISIILTLLSL